MTSPRYRSPVLGVAPLLASLGLACAASASPEIGQGTAPSPAVSEAGTVLLVSIDGFRPDYLDPAITPNLVGLAARGARAEMIPAFPTKTASRVDPVIGYLVHGLARRGLSGVNLIVVSDHGMSSLSPDRVIFLDDIVDLETVRVVDWSPVLAIWPGEGGDGSLESARGALDGLNPHLHVYPREEIPERYDLGSNERVAGALAPDFAKAR